MLPEVQSGECRRIAKIRSAMLLDEPFFGFLALRLKLVEDPSCLATWSDARSFGFNPAYTRKLLDIELKGLLCVIVVALAGGQHWRRKGRDAYLWNEACAYANNELTAEAGYQLPAGALRADRFRGKSAEHVYAVLEKEIPPAPPDATPPVAAPPEPGGDSDDDSDDEPAPGKGDENGEDGESKGDGDDEAAGGAGNGGAGDEDFELTLEMAPGMMTELRDPPPDEPKLKTELADAIECAAGMPGDLPGSLRTLVERELKGTADWRGLLAAFMQSSYHQQDYSYARPNLRYGGCGFIMPILRGNNMPPLVFVKDTSASILDLYRALMRAELLALIEEMKPEEVWVLDVDVKVQRVQNVLANEEDDLVHDTIGNGGTKFWPATKWVEDQGIEPCCMVYLTDLYGEFPKEPPPYPVLWMVPDENLRIPEVPFGEVVRLPLDPTM